MPETARPLTGFNGAQGFEGWDGHPWTVATLRTLCFSSAGWQAAESQVVHGASDRNIQVSALSHWRIEQEGPFVAGPKGW